MLKEEINLLAPEVKESRRRGLYARRGRRLFWVALVSLGFLYVAYAGAWWILAQHRQTLAKATIRVEGNGAIKTEVRDLNELLRSIHDHFQSYPAWSPLVEEALRATPATIRLTAVSLKEELGATQPALVLKGTATSRAAIIEYEQKLRGLQSVAALEAPLQNLASGDTISFSFTMYGRGHD